MTEGDKNKSLPTDFTRKIVYAFLQATNGEIKKKIAIQKFNFLKRTYYEINLQVTVKN